MSWLAAVAGALKALASWIGMKDRAEAKKAGQVEQQHADMVAQSKNVEKANEVERRVDAAGDPELERLRKKWTRPGS